MKKGSQEVDKTVDTANAHSRVFVSMAIDMSWRLALVVLVPIVGGYQLDKTLTTTPVLTITGFLLAMLGMAWVMWRTLQAANDVTPASPASDQPKQAKRL